MNPGEYEAMARVEQHHWWYRGLRDAYLRVLGAEDLRLPAEPRILDAGCGTGENLRSLAEHHRPSILEGFDLADEALAIAKTKAPGAVVHPGDICAPTLQEPPYDLVISLDVIYIPGVERALSGLETIVKAMRPGGLFIVNLPAYDWLYSRHDVAIHTSERYTIPRVRDLLVHLGLEIVRLSYRLCLLFPAVVLARIPGMFGARRGDSEARSDLHTEPGALANRLFFPLVRFENQRIAAGTSLPWGSSVFAVGRKP